MMKLSKIITALFATFLVFGIVGKASASELTQEQKESYYKEYVNILEKTNAKYDSDVKILPIEELKATDWVSTEEFSEIAEGMATAVWGEVPSKEISPYAASTGSKTVGTRLKGKDINVTVKGSFNTILVNDRQVFSPFINSITSSSNIGDWDQIDYTPSLIDGNRTMNVDVSGKWTYNSLYDTTIVSVSFYCSSSGSIQ